MTDCFYDADMSYQALLFCSDEKTARVVTQVLTELDFTVDTCNEPFAAVKKLMAQHFDAVVVDCDNEQNATLLFKSARNSGSNQNSLSVAVVEGQAGVAKAFRIGANLVLTKPINVEQSKGTLRVARGLLRKADASKPATATPEFPARPTQTSAIASMTQAASTAPVPFPAPSSSPAIAASASPFEVDDEPEPQPEAAEAALLESMPDPTARATKPAVPGSQTQAPWPTASKLSEPMAAALRRASEATGKSTIEPQAVTPTATSPSATDTGKFNKLNFGANATTAAAPAPAKDPSSAVTSFPKKPAAPSPNTARSASAVKTEAPAFSDLAVKDHEAAPKAASNSKFPIIAIAAVLLAAVGYFGWTKTHQATPPPASRVVTSAPIAAPAPAAAPTVQPQVQNPAVTADTSQHAIPAVSAKPSPAKSLPADEPDVITIKPATHEKPMMVKAAPSTESPAEAAPALPGAIGIPSSSDNRQIAGIVSSAPATIPKATPQTLRISQGVSQGLLVKKVQPTYPQAAQQMRIQGAVQLEASISKSGDITSVKLLSGDPILARAATDAVRKWKYNPYFLNGEPVEIQTVVTVNFKLP